VSSSSESPSRLNKLEVEIAELTKDINVQVFCFDSLSSVMDADVNLKIDRPTMLLAKSQSKGRGQRGNNWNSSAGAILTCLCFPLQNLDIKALAPLSLVFAIQVATLLNEHGLDVCLKWPNDVLMRKNLKKISGILLETAIKADKKDNYLKAGIGINLLEHPQEGTSFQTESGYTPSYTNLCAELFQKCSSAINDYRNVGFEDFHVKWNQFDLIKAHKVIFESDGKQFSGIASGVDSHGRFLLNTPDAKLAFDTGRIRYFSV
jgi:BirA family biotin operon repressor/biotin-[acetyl-CoA-carboxylase] ligase